jgi:molybdopterin-guanine dinucleotide biosynthesis protein
LTSIWRTDVDTPLVEIAASLDSGYALLVAEGFKDSAVPKVLVMGGASPIRRTESPWWAMTPSSQRCRTTPSMRWTVLPRTFRTK